MKQKTRHDEWVICFAGLPMIACNIGFCSSILTLYLPYAEAAGFFSFPSAAEPLSIISAPPQRASPAASAV